MPPVSKKPRARQKTFFRQWRDFRGLSQEEVADRCEIDRSTVSRVERGENPYDQDFLERFALAVGCDPQDLISIDPLKSDAPRLIYSHVRKATHEKQQEILRIVEALLKAG